MAVQHLVLLRRLEVVVTVASEFVQHDPANVGIGIPGVVGLHPFVSTRFKLVPQQSIVLDVIDAFQEQKGDHTCPDRTQHGLEGKQEPHCAQISRLDEVVPEHVVFDREERPPLTLQKLHLKAPSVHILLGHRREPKAIHRLVVTRSGSVRRRGHIQMMPKIVLNEKVHVQARHVQQFAHQSFWQRSPVAELVGHVDSIGRKQNPSRNQQSNHLKGGVRVAFKLTEKESHQAKHNENVAIEHRIEHPHAILFSRHVAVQVRGALPCNHIQDWQHNECVKHR